MCKFLWECSIWSAFLTEHQFTVRLIMFKKNPYLLWLKKHFRAKLWLFQAFFKNCWLLIIVIEKLTADLLYDIFHSQIFLVWPLYRLHPRELGVQRQVSDRAWGLQAPLLSAGAPQPEAPQPPQPQQQPAASEQLR